MALRYLLAVVSSAPAAFKAAAAASALGPWKAQHLLHSSSSADPHHPDDAVDDARGLLPLHAVRHAATGVNMWTAPAVKGKPPAPRCDPTMLRGVPEPKRSCFHVF